MANTVRAENGSEIYKDKIYQLSDEYIQMELSIDLDEIKIPENKKIIADNFDDMIYYISDNINKPSNDDIGLLDNIFNIYLRLCTRYSVLPTLDTFSDLVGINNATFTDWANGEYRVGSAHGKTVKKWKDICGKRLMRWLHQHQGSDGNKIFTAKAAYGYSEGVQQIEIKSDNAPALSQEDIRQIADQARKESIPELIEGLPDE